MFIIFSNSVSCSRTPDEMSMELTSEGHVGENFEIKESEPPVTGKGPSTENASPGNHSNAKTLKDNEILQVKLSLPEHPGSRNYQDGKQRNENIDFCFRHMPDEEA
ncbi:Hypothetical predicted protein [Octopus vulgaris]|uniref:Uncharacterized protein n=1 Tax=Octopus vulgaris TaxID=6645 RepID=A0AA36BDX9_OCTVU|nr:Hypothetical predicted protein [Octopus vulgaris]